MSLVSGNYYALWDTFSNSVRERRYGDANTTLKELLKRAERSLASGAASDLNFVMTLGTTPGAVAALAEDPDTLALMRRVADRLGDDQRSDVEKYEADANAVANVRQLLIETPEIRLEDLRSVVADSVRGRLGRLVAWMEKNSEVSVAGAGAQKVVTAGAPSRVRSVLPPTFRLGEIAAYAQPLWLGPLLGELDEPDDLAEMPGGADDAMDGPDQVIPDDVEVPLTPIARLPVSGRLPGVMTTYPMREGLWLVGRGASRVDGSGETRIVVKDWSGSTLRSFSLPHHVVRAFASYRRDHIIVLTSRLDVFVLDLEGTYITEMSLAGSPEVRESLHELGGSAKATAALRGVDISPTTGDVAFSFLDKVWSFTRAGSLKFCHQILRGFPVDATALALRPGTELAMREDLAGGHDHEWIHHLRFSDMDDSLFVSSYGGHLFRFGPAGGLLDTWHVEGPALDLSELRPGRLVVATDWNGTFDFVEGCEPRWYPQGGRLWSESLIIGDGVLDLERQSGGDLPHRGVRGVYPTEDGIRVEFKTTFQDSIFGAVPQT